MKLSFFTTLKKFTKKNHDPFGLSTTVYLGLQSNLCTTAILRTWKRGRYAEVLLEKYQ